MHNYSDKSEVSLGANYFQIRDDLDEIIKSLVEIEKFHRITPGRINALKNLYSNLENPFLFVVVGEVNVGKSSFLNALFGKEFCMADVTPTTDKINFFKYGKESHDFDFSENIVESFRPEKFLRNFNIVDTPGTNSIELQHQKITEQFLPMADVVLFVFPVTNPWGATAWDFLDKIHHQWHKKIVFVLQQCDLRSDEEVYAILDHLKKTAKHRFGHEFPCFPVSAKQTFLKKTKKLNVEELKKTTQFNKLEDYITGIIESSQARLIKLIQVYKVSDFVFKELKEKLKSISEIIKADEELLSNLKPICDYQKNRSLKKCEHLFESFNQSFLSSSLKVETFLESNYGFFLILFAKEESSKKFQGIIISETMKSIRKNITSGANIIKEDVEEVWDKINSDIEEKFNLKLSIGENEKPDFSIPYEKLIKNVSGISLESLNGINFSNKLNKVVLRIVKSVRINFVIFIILTIAGILSISFKIKIVIIILFSISTLFLIFSLMHVITAINKIRNFYSSLIQNNQDKIAKIQKDAFINATDTFYLDFISIFDPLKKVCLEYKKKYEPRLKVIKHVGDNLEKIKKILLK